MERLWSFLFLYSPRLFQAQRSTVEHTQVLEESAEGIQVWWPEGYPSLVTKRVEPHGSEKIEGGHGCSAGERDDNRNNVSWKDINPVESGDRKRTIYINFLDVAGDVASNYS